METGHFLPGLLGFRIRWHDSPRTPFQRSHADVQVDLNELYRMDSFGALFDARVPLKPAIYRLIC